MEIGQKRKGGETDFDEEEKRLLFKARRSFTNTMIA